jgi:Zn-dependent protease/CBS domain-containing protein
MKGFKIGSIAGFQISINWSWLVIFALVIYSLALGYFPEKYPRLGDAVYWTIGLLASLLLFGSVLAHELMHSIVARHYGLEIKGITLFIFGGVSQTGAEPQDPKVEFNMAIAGPLMSLLLGIIFQTLTFIERSTGTPSAIVAVTGYLGYINIALAVFNLVPGFPLDGGRVLRAALWRWTGNMERATRYASFIGQGFGYSLMSFGVVSILIFRSGDLGGIWFILIGWFLAGAARNSYDQLLVREALSGVEVRSVMTSDTPSVAPQLSVEDFVHDYLMRHEYSCYPVTEGSEVRGIVSLDEVRRVPKEKWPTTTVSEITRPVDGEQKVEKGDDVWDAMMKLASQDCKRLLVMDDGKLDGTITQENILHLIRTKMRLGM